ncbi:MAG: glycosyltransferase family 2 protein [Ilumatobacteraceae bacterium]
MSTTYSFVIPVHNEEEMLRHLHGELDSLMQRLDGPAEVIFVDDGSHDSSWSILEELSALDERCSAVRLSRNFGHQVAVSAGLDRADGDAVIIMDADLQDPPEVVLAMALRWREGYDVVFGQRIDRSDDSRFKRSTAAGFYRVLRRLSSVDIPEQVGDFRLVDRKVVEAIRAMPERNRYVRGMFAWLGFSQIGVPYARPARVAGTTSYTLKRMLRLASDGVVGYSKSPLRAPMLVGTVVTAAGVVGGAAAGVIDVVRGRPGRTALAAGVTVFAGIQLMAIGVLGEYIARIFDESLGRPLYVVRGGLGRLAAAPTGPRAVDESEDVDGQLHEIFERRSIVSAPQLVSRAR